MNDSLKIVLCGGCYYLWERPLSDYQRCEHPEAPEDPQVPPTGYTPEWCPKMKPQPTTEVFTPPPSVIEERAMKYPVKRVPEQVIDAVAEGVEDVRLVSVTYPPSVVVEDVPFASHDWTCWPGGPPSNLHYEWCRACGTLKVMARGEPPEYHVPGEPRPAMTEPPCKGTKP